MAKKQIQTKKQEIVESIQVSLRIDMTQAENLIRDLAKAYGWDGLQDLIDHLRQEATGK